MGLWSKPPPPGPPRHGPGQSSAKPLPEVTAQPARHCPHCRKPPPTAEKTRLPQGQKGAAPAQGRTPPAPEDPMNPGPSGRNQDRTSEPGARQGQGRDVPRDDCAPACGPTFAYRCRQGAVTSSTPFPGGIRHHSPIRGTSGGDDIKARFVSLGPPISAGAFRLTPRPAATVRSTGPTRHGPSCIGLSTKVPCRTRLRVQEVPRLSVEAWCGVLGHRLLHH